MGEKKISALFLMLLLVEGEEKECLLKFGVLIFILAHEIKQFYSLSWKHCMCLQAHAASFSKSRVPLKPGRQTPLSLQKFILLLRLVSWCISSASHRHWASDCMVVKLHLNNEVRSPPQTRLTLDLKFALTLLENLLQV